MKKLTGLFFRCLLLLSAFTTTGQAHDFRETLSVQHATARATVPQQSVGAAYVTIENRGKHPEKLIALSSPLAASTELHRMSMQNGMMSMREVAELTLPAETSITMKPGDGYHIMLNGLKKPLKAGDQFPLQLTFQHAGKVDIQVLVN